MSRVKGRGVLSATCGVQSAKCGVWPETGQLQSVKGQGTVQSATDYRHSTHDGPSSNAALARRHEILTMSHDCQVIT